MKITTEEMNNRIEKAKNDDEIRAVLADIKEVKVLARLNELCEAHGKSCAQVQDESGLAKSTFYACINGKRKFRKEHIIRIGFALGLSVEELNDLLKITQHKELYAKNKVDAIFIYALNNNKELFEIEPLLKEAGVDIRLYDSFV